MELADMRTWLLDDGHNVDGIDAPEGYEFVERIQIGGVSMLVASPEDRPHWRLETRMEVQFGDHQIDQTGRSKLKLHLRSVFQRRDTDYEISDTDDGVAATLTTYLYPEDLNRQQFMDRVRHMQHSGLLVTGEVDRFVVGLVA